MPRARSATGLSLLLHGLVGAAAAMVGTGVAAIGAWQGADRASFELSIAPRQDPAATRIVAPTPPPATDAVPQLAAAATDFLPELEVPQLPDELGGGRRPARLEAPLRPPPVEQLARCFHAATLPDADASQDPSPPEADPDADPEAAAAAHPAQDGASVAPSAVPGCNQPPRYPFVAWRRGIEGTVVVELDLDADGVVRATRLAVSSGCALLDDAAVQQLATWRFAPARGPRGPIPCTFRQDVVFRIRK